MSRVRLFALFLSLALHGALFYALWHKTSLFALREGKGSDDLTVVASITLTDADGLDVLPERVEPQHASVAVAPAQPTKRVEETGSPQHEKAPEDASSIEPLPGVDKKPSPDRAIRTDLQSERAQRAVAAAVPLEEQEAARRAREGRRVKLESLYQGEIFTALLRHRVNPQSRRTGRVVVLATINPAGVLISRQVIQSSGFEVLDRAALASLDRSTPFPPIPPELSEDSLTLRVPFDYSTR